MSLHGGNIREASLRYKIAVNDIIDFSANINPLGFPKKLSKIISGNLNSVLHYPDPDCSDLRLAFSKHFGISEHNLLMGNGSIELIYLIASALKVRRALILGPTFSEYEKAVLAAAGECLFLEGKEEDNFRISSAQVLNNLDRVNLVFICNPNNPTGALFDRANILALVRECEKLGVFVVVDEVFMDFVEEKDEASVLEFASRSKCVMVLRSLTKFFAISGLRLGTLVAGEELIRRIKPCQYPWSVNAFAQLAGVNLLKEKAFINRSSRYVFRQRGELLRNLGLIKYLRPYPAKANFVFCKILGGKLDSGKLCDYCGCCGIILRDCSNFRGLDNSFIRVAVRKKEENAKLIKVLKELE